MQRDRKRTRRRFANPIPAMKRKAGTTDGPRKKKGTGRLQKKKQAQEFEPWVQKSGGRKYWGGQRNSRDKRREPFIEENKTRPSATTIAKVKS